jgi:hypothetical protein
MNSALAERLNELPQRLLADDVRHGRGLGNELGFFIFDYEPEVELQVRRQIPSIISRMTTLEPGYSVAAVNMFGEIIGSLTDQDLLERAIELEHEMGPEETLDALRQAVSPVDVAKRIVAKYPPSQTDLYLLHGIGSAYPLMRAHALLSNLHSPLQGKPLVMFFPGRFTGRRLVLFGKLHDDHYYRAFRLFENPC